MSTTAGEARPAAPPARLVFLAVAVHATLAQLMYGGFLVSVHAPIPQVRGAAQLMYYGGDIAELLLAAALVATWRPARRRPGARAPGQGAGKVPCEAVKE